MASMTILVENTIDVAETLDKLQRLINDYRSIDFSIVIIDDTVLYSNVNLNKLGLSNNSTVNDILSKTLKGRTNRDKLVVLSDKDYMFVTNIRNGSHYIYMDEYITRRVMKSLTRLIEDIA